MKIKRKPLAPTPGEGLRKLSQISAILSILDGNKNAVYVDEIVYTEIQHDIHTRLVMTPLGDGPPPTRRYKLI